MASITLWCSTPIHDKAMAIDGEKPKNNQLAAHRVATGKHFTCSIVLAFHHSSFILDIVELHVHLQLWLIVALQSVHVA